jgi:hypothetical protein
MGMSLQLDPTTNKILYQGREVGQHRRENGKSTVTLDITYETASDEWFAPLSCFAQALSNLPENRPAKPDLFIETPEDCIAEVFAVERFLIERTVKQGNYLWRFNKNDPDPWPSLFHGHEYDRGLKLDVITGDIFDEGTRKRCSTLKRKNLRRVQDELRASKDFRQKVEAFINKSDNT